MKQLSSFRLRLLWLAVFPVVLIAVALAAVFMVDRIDDLDQAYAQRSRLLIRQLASASEYGLFSGNTESLQRLLDGALTQPDVLSATIFDANGDVLVRAANADLLSRFRHEKMLERLLEPVTSSQAQLAMGPSNGASFNETALTLGKVVIEMSRESVVAQSRDVLLLGVAVTLVGVLLGVFLAARLSRGVLGPVQRMSQMMQLIGQGDLTARVKWIAVDDPLRDLQQGLNSMAERLAQGRDELEQRIKEATDALRLRTEEAEAANQAKLQFIAAASHDLRQPTHALGLFVSRLGQLVDDPKTLELVNDLELALHDMQDLLDVLLDFSRLQEKTFQPRLQAIDLQELLENLGASFSMQAASKGLSLKVRTRAAWVLSDPVLLRQIVLNLISNALRYTKQGRILVACRALAQGSRLRLEVWDTGIGIAAEHQQAIFKEYFQLSNAERDRRKGLGLGLSIVQRAADLLGHPVKLRSVPGRGSCFSIELPCTQRVYDPAPSPSPPSLLQGLSVLLVEDDPMVVKASEGLLSSWACHFRSAENLDSALRLIELGFSPDILISDYRLPGDFDGIAVLQQLQRACGMEIPAVLITGDTEENIIQRAKSAGMTVMHKPLRPAKLRSLLKNLRITAQI